MNNKNDSVSAGTLRANEAKRDLGETALLNLASGASVIRNPIPYSVTEANKENISPTACAGGYNPQHDAAQRTFERKDTGTAPSYRQAVRALAARIADKHIRQARMRCDHLREEFIVEAESAVGEFFAERIRRFPTLTHDMLARFACDALPPSTVRALHRCAHRACDARQARMSGKSRLVDPSFFDLFASRENADTVSAELTAAWVNARIDSLLALVRQRGATAGNAARSARAHAALLEEARDYFTKAIVGEAAELPAAGMVRASVAVGFNVVTERKQSGAVERVASSRGYIVTESAPAESLGTRALYMRLYRLADFIGATDIQTALARGQTCPTKGRGRAETRVQANS